MYGLPDWWSEDEAEMYSHLLGSIELDALMDDETLKMYHHFALWDWDTAADKRAEYYDLLVTYVESEYGIDFNEIYEWDEYRDKYDAM